MRPEMEFLQRLPIPRRLAARVWLFTVPSGLVSFERRQGVPQLPIGGLRFLGLLLIAAGLAILLRGAPGRPGVRQPGSNDARPTPLNHFRERPAVSGGLLLLGGAGLFLRSLLLIAYAFGLAFAFARQTIELEDPQVPRLPRREPDWEYDETHV